MKRLVYAFDSAAAAKEALSSLARIGVQKNHLSLAARPDVQLEQIPDTSIDPSMDFGPSIARGVALGGTTGVFAGLVMMAIPPLGIALGGASLLGFLAGGALVGAWSSAIVGSSIPDAVRRKFEDEIAAGRILLVVQVDADKENAVRAAMAAENRNLVWQDT